MKKRDYSILLGNAIDHFDTALYGFLAPIFASSFFPNSDPLISLILAYSVFTTTIITRPLGSYIFGMIAVTHGAAMSLSYSLIGVAASAFALGILPTYEQIGPWAPILLIILRSLSGIFSAGEITIAKLYILTTPLSQDESHVSAEQKELSEKTKEEITRSNKSSYWYQTSTMVGIVIASFVSTLVLNPGDENYWRLCFIIGGILALFGYVLRIYKTEKLSLSKQKLLELYSITGFKILWHNKILLIRIAIVSGFSYITYSVPFIVMNNLVPQFTSISIEQMMQANTVLLVMDMIFLPIIGSSLAKYNSKATLLVVAILLLITSPIIWSFAKNSSFGYLLLIKIWIIIIGVIFACKINLWSNNLIKENEKYLIIGIGGSIGSAAIGKMTPAICLSLYHYFNSPVVVGWFMAIISISTIWALMQKSNK